MPVKYKKKQATRSNNVENGLELLDECPLLHGDFGPVELLERVDGLAGDERVQ